MKKYSLILIFVITCLAANAQSCFDYHQFSIGAGYGITKYGAGQASSGSMAFNLNANYYITPFSTLTLETQIGKLIGGGTLANGAIRQFSNNYYTAIVHADLQAGELIDYARNSFLNGLKNAYIGTGLGLLLNNSTVKSINDTAYNSYTVNSKNLLIPIRVGYDFKIFNGYNEPQFRLDIAYSFNTAFGKGIDGAYNPYSRSSIKFYNYFSLGLKFGLGSVKRYRKAIDFSPI